MASIFDQIGTFIGANKSWLEPLANLGSDYLERNTQGNYQQGLQDYMRQQELQNFQDNQNYNQAVQDYYNQYNSYASGEAAMARANAAARAAAAKQTEENRLRAKRKGLKVKKEGFQRAQEFLAPYVQAGQEVLPQMTQAYGTGISGLGELYKALLQQSQEPKKGLTDTVYDLPDYLGSK